MCNTVVLHFCATS